MLPVERAVWGFFSVASHRLTLVSASTGRGAD
jgi:hypothetical protein